MESKKYSILSRLGQGAHGSVLKARNLETNRIVAVKQILLKEDSHSQLRVFREVQCLRQCDHENIVRLLEVFFPENEDCASIVSIVLEFAESNMRLVISDTRRPLCELIPRFYFTQILYGIAYLHDIGIMHRDLKPDNILITSKNGIRIADFGLACIYFPNDPEREYEHQIATRWYRAPELLFGSTKYTPKVDIWAFGCILAEFFNGFPLFSGSTDIEQLFKIFQKLGTPTEESWPNWELLPDAGKVLFDPAEPIKDWAKLVPLADFECLALIRSILQLNPAKRPSALVCLDFPFFSSHARFDSINFYKPPLLEDNLERRPPEIVFRMMEGGED